MFDGSLKQVRKENIMKRQKTKIQLLVVLLFALFTPVLSFAGKQEARDVGTGLSVISAAGVVIPEPLTTAAGVGGLVGEGTGFVVMGIWDLFAAAPANPDPDHGTLASVTAVTFTPVVGSGQVFDNVNTSLLFAGYIIDNSRLLNMSLERYYGALNDGNPENTELQLLAASQAFFGLDDAIMGYRSSLTAISSDISGTDFASLSATVTDVLDLRDEILISGFPSYEDFVFAEMHATSEEMSNAILEVSFVTGDTITDSDLTGAVIFDRYASALGEVDIREMLPPDFTVVPEPATICLLGLGTLTLRRRRRA